MQRTIIILAALAASFLVGGVVGRFLFPVTKELQVVKHLPATDDQLLSWWFGTGDKVKLRKRVCHGY